MMPLLDVRNLSTVFHMPSRDVHAVNNVSYSLQAGESLAIVGESGSGKSVSVLSLIDLVPSPGKVDYGQVRLNDPDVLML